MGQVSAPMVSIERKRGKNMKNMIGLLLALSMVLALSGCGSPNVRETLLEEAGQETEEPGILEDTDALLQEPVEEEDFTADEPSEEDVSDTPEEEAVDLEEEGEETETFAPGTNDGRVYENASLGIGCELDSEWIFYTDEEILEVNNLSPDAGAEEVAQLLESTPIQEMYAFKDDGFTTLNIVVSKLTPMEALAYQMDPDGVFTESYDSMVEELSVGLEETGCSQVSVSAFQETTVAGRAGKTLSISAYYDETYPVYETIAMFVQGEYLVMTTGCTWLEDGSAALLEVFYALS